VAGHQPPRTPHSPARKRRNNWFRYAGVKPFRVRPAIDQPASVVVSEDQSVEAVSGQSCSTDQKLLAAACRVRGPCRIGSSVRGPQIYVAETPISLPVSPARRLPRPRVDVAYVLQSATLAPHSSACKKSLPVIAERRTAKLVEQVQILDGRVVDAKRHADTGFAGPYEDLWRMPSVKPGE